MMVMVMDVMSNALRLVYTSLHITEAASSNLPENSHLII